MNRLLVIGGVVLLLIALVFLNQGMKKAARPDHDEDEQAQTQQAKVPAASSAQGTPGSVPLPEEALGDPATARYRLQVGWVYDEANQKKPETLTAPLQTIRDYVQHSGNLVSAEIVDLDVPVEDRSPAAQTVTELGIHVNGQTIHAGNLSQSPEQIPRALSALIRNG